MVTCLQLAMPAASLSSLPNQTNRRWRCKPLCAANIPMPPQNPKDPFLARLASIARSKPNLKPKLDLKLPPFLDVYQSPNMVGGSVEGEEEETQEAGVDDRKNPPPDLPSSLLDGRIVFIGLPADGAECFTPKSFAKKELVRVYSRRRRGANRLVEKADAVKILSALHIT